MSMSLELVVARGTARSLINGSAASSYEMVISLSQDIDA
jgi:plasmid maintenance system antidote protein VapI